ncbi:MAG: sensor histidine kinase [Ignavibacteriales bacterium]
MPDEAGSPHALADPLSYEARLEAVLETISDGFYALDRDWTMVVFNRAAEQYFGVSREQVLGRNLWEIFPQGVGTQYEQFLRAARDEGKANSFEAPSLLSPGHFVELRVLPMRDGGVAVCLTDITERREAEERQRLLVNELNHRVKNTLATVQAISAQSLRDGVPDTVRERFTSRLMALARANDVLVTGERPTASIRLLAEQMASPHGGEEEGRFVITGPDVELTPRAAVALALGLHELATNAAKYGALSSPDGRVVLDWWIEGEALRLTWREDGGPPVQEPTVAGFGSRLLNRGLAGDLKADVNVSFPRSGAICEMSAPLEAVVARP